MKLTKSQLRKMINEARMAEYGKHAAAQGLPASKVGRKNKEYMDAYEQEKENQISAREQRFGDALKEEMDDELGFATGERVLEFLAAQLNVREEDAPDFLRWVADRLEGE